MNLVEPRALERTVSIALPKHSGSRDWHRVFADSCQAAGLNGRSIKQVGDRFSCVEEVVNGYSQRLDFCDFAGDGAFFVSHLFHAEPTSVSFSQNGDLYFQIHLRGIADNVTAGKSNAIHGPTCMLTYYPRDSTRVRRARPNQEWVSGSICIKPQSLISEFEIRPYDLPYPLCELLRGDLTESFSLEFPLSAEIARALHSVLDCADRSSLRQVLMEARGREIVYWMLREVKGRHHIVQQRLNAIGVKTAKIEKVQAILESELNACHSLQSLADRAGLSRTSLSLGFKQWCGMAVFEYLHQRRMERARQLLEENRHSVQQVAGMTGYQDESAFSRAFRKHYGIQPTSVVHKAALFLA